LSDSERKVPGAAGADSQTQDQKLQAMITLVWERSRHTVAERAAVLRSAADRLMEGPLDEPTQQSAVDCAHKLAGVLGTFGLARGTDLAREAEVFFGKATPDDKEEIQRLQGTLAELAHLIDKGP
jgi:HPt (histidine-containing phosphotransfer) domain-containing protein